MEKLKNIEYKIYVSIVLKGKRVASRSNTGSNIEYRCIKSMAETEIYMGEKVLKNLILINYNLSL